MTPPDLDLDHFSGLLLAERAQISRALVAIHADSSTLARGRPPAT